MTKMTEAQKARKAEAKKNKSAHLKACRDAFKAGEARRSAVKDGRIQAHLALLAGRQQEAAERKNGRIAAHVERNAQAKKPANDVAARVADAA